VVWILLALLFAALWTYALFREDHRQPEPVWMVLLAVVAGAAAAPAAEYVEQWLVPDLSLMTGTLLERARLAFFVAGPVEEGLKLAALLVLVWRGHHFDEAMDGLVYAAAAGAGFALVENLAYMQDDPLAVLARGPIATGAHVLFATIWGGALGHAGHVSPRWRRAAIVAAGWLAAGIAHGAFDLIVFSVDRELTIGQARAAQIVLMLGCALFLRWRVRVALPLPPFRFRPAR
jgi:RsiW-degrading membrane proteinase PrsW (M82 family)